VARSWREGYGGDRGGAKQTDVDAVLIWKSKAMATGRNWAPIQGMSAKLRPDRVDWANSGFRLAEDKTRISDGTQNLPIPYGPSINLKAKTVPTRFEKKTAKLGLNGYFR